MKAHKIVLAVGTAMIAASTVAMAQTPNPATPKPETPDAHTTTSPASSTTPTSAEAPTSLSVYFASGSSTLAPKEQATLDEASRIFNDGKPIVMIITGMADATGSAGPNLLLSQKRADIVFQGLIARGLPPNHFQILAAGTTASLSGKEPSGPDQAYRKVEITWR